MSRISEVLDIKPSGGLVSEVKPNLGIIEQNLPRLSKVYAESMQWSNTGRGMPIGLLLTLTYPCDRRL